MSHIPLTAALALILAACGQSTAPAATDGARGQADSPAPPPAPSSPSRGYIAGTGEATPAAEPATDEVPTSPGSDAEDTQYFDFDGEALTRIRRDGRAATPALRDAARDIVDTTGEERGCGTYPEGERLFMLDLDGRPGDEALLLYTMEGCEGVENYYDRNGYVLRQIDGEWRPAGEFSLGTRMAGPARITSIAGGRLVVTPEDGSMAKPVEVSFTP